MSQKTDFMAYPEFYYLEVRVDENGVLSMYDLRSIGFEPTAIYINSDYKQQYIRSLDMGWNTLQWNCGASKKAMDLITPANKKMSQSRYMQFSDIESLNAYANTHYPKCPLDKS